MTFIVGFPGETEEDFAFLLDWLREARLTRVGCFKYENVEGAASRDLDGHVPEELKAERFERFMAVQRQVSEEVLAAQVGKTVEVLIDEVDEDGATGRSGWDAPDIDGSVFIEDLKTWSPATASAPRLLTRTTTIFGRRYYLLREGDEVCEATCTVTHLNHSSTSTCSWARVTTRTPGAFGRLLA